jgi:hypothetical protein
MITLKPNKKRIAKRNKLIQHASLAQRDWRRDQILHLYMTQKRPKLKTKLF